MSLHKRLKSLIFAGLSMFSLWTAPVLAAGTTPLSLVQQFDSTGAPLASCLLYFYQAGTVATPQNAYADFGLTTTLPNPLTCDQSGRIPQHWLADGLIHIRLTDSSGVVQVDTTMQVLGPSSGGGGGGGTVDPTSILGTGDLKFKYGTGSLSGFVRANGLTIGDAISGATERANADTQPLFIYLYNADANLVVSGGRTGNALNDYNANKNITLPDWRGRIPTGLDDMGNTAAGRLTLTYLGCAGTTLGCAGGLQTHTPAASDVPSGATVSVSGTVTVATPGGDPVPLATNTVNSTSYQVGGSNSIPVTNGGWGNATSFSGANTLTGTTTGAGTPFGTLPPMMLTTFYIKL